MLKGPLRVFSVAHKSPFTGGLSAIRSPRVGVLQSANASGYATARLDHHHGQAKQKHADILLDSIPTSMASPSSRATKRIIES